jgi:hypothetical protein
MSAAKKRKLDPIPPGPVTPRTQPPKALPLPLPAGIGHADVSSPSLRNVSAARAARLRKVVGSAVSKTSPCDALYHVNCLTWWSEGKEYENQLEPFVFATKRSALLYACKLGYEALRATKPEKFGAASAKNPSPLLPFNAENVDVFLAKSNVDLDLYLKALKSALTGADMGQLYNTVKQSTGTIATADLLDRLSR